ncbi:MAG: GNAT family protein, partial [Chloroflexota bacterium]|nr:GNAT family protein [Chloroflexota bacterium]
KDRWGQGYGRDALRTFLGYLFGDMGLKEVFLATFPQNIRARRCFTSCGFRRSGTDRELFLDWGWRDEILMEISREEFLERMVQEAAHPENVPEKEH